MSVLRVELQASLSDAYVVEREIGRGGMVTVFLARDASERLRFAENWTRALRSR